MRHRGNPVAGASVTVRGATYTGSSSPQVTGPDGTFCVDVMRSEAPGEDVDGNGVPGETHQVTVSVAQGASLYNLGPYNIPPTSATCENGGCLNLGPIRLEEANKLTVGLCQITGTVVYAEDGSPVSNAMVYAFDENLDQEIWIHFMTNSSVTLFANTDENGSFSMNIPLLAGVSVFATFSKQPGAHTSEVGFAQRDARGCPAEPLLLQAERFLTYQVMDASGQVAGNIWQTADVASIHFAIGTETFWVEVPAGVPSHLPAQPGASVTFDLHSYNSASADTKRGTITFTATTQFGGTWQTTGVSLNGTWGN
jgi:hypothetical protein